MNMNRFIGYLKVPFKLVGYELDILDVEDEIIY